MKRLLQIAAIVAVAVALAGCGNSGGDSSSAAGGTSSNPGMVAGVLDAFGEFVASILGTTSDSTEPVSVDATAATTPNNTEPASVAQ